MGIDSSREASHKDDLNAITNAEVLGKKALTQQQRKQNVIDKLNKMYKRMDEKDLNTFADILSDKDKLFAT